VVPLPQKGSHTARNIDFTAKAGTVMDIDNKDVPASQLLTEVLVYDAGSTTERPENINQLVTNRSDEDFFRGI